MAALALGLTLGLPGRAEPKGPATPDPQVQHGAELYGRMCAVCHGAAGEGYVADQAPRLAQPDFLASVSDDYLRTAIANGRRGSTMSAWANNQGGPLAPADIDAVVLFIRGWQRQPAVKLDERPLSGNIQEGVAIYADRCARCHGATGVGGKQMQIANPQFLASASNGFLRHAIRHGRPGTEMPAFGELLQPQQIDDVIGALRNFRPSAPEAMGFTRPPPLPLGPVPLNPDGPEPEGFKATPDTTPADVVHAQLERGARFALLDARAPSDYLREHITGAVSVPFYDPSPYLDALPKDAWLVCYCACPHAESGQLARALMDHGFTKVTVLDEGLGVWRSRQYPVTTASAGTPTRRD